MIEPFGKAFTERGKKGDAALVATILLIVLAVSVGVIVSSFSQKTEEKVSGQIKAMGSSVECQDVSIGIDSIKVGSITLKNRGSLGIEELMVRIYAADVEVDAHLSGDDRLLPGDSTIYSNNAINENLNIEVIPMLRSEEGELIGCENKMIVWRGES